MLPAKPFTFTVDQFKEDAGGLPPLLTLSELFEVDIDPELNCGVLGFKIVDVTQENLLLIEYDGAVYMK